MFEYDRIRKTKTFCSACMCYDLIRTFCMDEKVCLLLCMEESLFCFRKMTMTTWHLDWSHVIVVTIYGICLRHCDNSWSFERCFVAVDRICCCEMLVGGTAEVQLRDPCTLTHMLLASYNILYYNNRQLVLFATLHLHVPIYSSPVMVVLFTLLRACTESPLSGVRTRRLKLQAFVHSAATQLNSTRRRVELRRRCAMNTSTTQLNSTSSWVELSWVVALWTPSTTLRRRRWPSPTIVGGSENFRTLRRNWPSRTAYIQSALSRSVTCSCLFIVYFVIEMRVFHLFLHADVAAV